MKFLALLGLSLLGAALADDLVVALETEDTFDTFIADNEVTMVEFYAPWCGHCKKLLPEFEKAATKLAEEDIKLAKVDCTSDDNKDLCSRFGVTGYPTIKFFKSGKDSSFEGGRDEKSIIQFIKGRMGPAVTDLADEAAVKKFTKDGITVIEFRAEGASKHFTSIAEGMLDTASCGSVKDEAVAKAFDVESLPAIVLFRDFDEPVVKFEGDVTKKKAIEDFIKGNLLPSLGEIGPENYKTYTETGLPLMWIASDLEDHKDLHDAIRPEAREFKGKLHAVILDGKKFASHVKNLGYSGDLPGIILTDGQKKYLHPEGELTGESVKQFMQDFVDGKLEPFLKSAEPPADNDGPVTVVVGKTFDELVTKSEKDVLVEFYAPWCGHCKKLEPEYDDLGKRFADEDNIIIAKMDATENDGPIEIQGFPTLYFFTPGKEPQQYQGGRTADAIEKWLKANAPGLKHLHDEL